MTLSRLAPAAVFTMATTLFNLVLGAGSSTLGATGVPNLDSLASSWQRVRVCNPSHTPLKPCHGLPPNTWNTSTACADAGCCWLPTHDHSENPDGDDINGDSESFQCYAPNDSDVVGFASSANAQRFAANQQSPSLSNGAGMLMAVKNGSPLGISCLTLPPYAGECQTGHPETTLGGGMTVATASASALFDTDSRGVHFQQLCT